MTQSHYQPAQQDPQPTPKRSVGKRVVKVLFGVLGGLVVFSIGTAAGHASSTTNTAAMSAPTVAKTITVTVTPSPAPPLPSAVAAPPSTITVISTVQAPPVTVFNTVTQPAAPQTAEAAAGIVEGTYAVGTDIQPGTYHTAGAAPTPFGTANCYWARMKDTSGDLTGIIANNNTTGPSTVTIARTDGAFITSGCQPWVKVK